MNILKAEAGNFAMAGDADIGGGLTLLVFKDNFVTSTSTALLGDADLLAPGDKAEQAVHEGATPGLYPVTVVDPYGYSTNSRGMRYRAIYIEPDEDQTKHGDSGSGLYSNDQVYGVNNAGDGIYGAITEISHIRSLATNMAQRLRPTP